MLENEPQIDYHIYKTYQIMGMVGKGTYGQVYKVKNKKTQQIFAIKKICDAYQNITDAKRTYRELNYLFQLQHPCIVKLYHIIPGNKKLIGPNRQSNTTRTDFLKNLHQESYLGYNTQKTHDGTYNNTKLNKHVYAVFQFVQSDLSKALRRCKLESIQRKYIAYQILNGVAYLHKSKLIHRDIKPSNILIDTDCGIKICDFGLCRIKQQKNKESQYQQNIITQYVASRWYRPPQILLGFSPCDQAIDMWGVGCVISQLILRSAIFPGQSTIDQLQKIFRIIGLPGQKQINKLQSQHAKFLLRTFTFSRKNRPQRLNQVLSESSDEQLDLIQKLLKFNPQDRLSAQDALKHNYFKQMKQIGNNFQIYNNQVNILDYSQPSTFSKQFAHISMNNKQIQKINTKKKQISLQQYQNLIQELQRTTARSSNRFNKQQISSRKDQIIQINSNNVSERQKQKSTRQSNYLSYHQNKQKIPQQIKQTNKILENYNKQKSCSSSHKIGLVQMMKDGRNAQSTMDHYQSNNMKNNQSMSSHYNFLSTNEMFIENNRKKQDSKNNGNKSMQDNLQQQYQAYFNPFQKQVKRKLSKNLLKNKKGNQNGNSFQNIKKMKKLSTNKSTNKISTTINQKSFGKNNSKNKTHLATQHLDQNKNKYNSFKSLNSTQNNANIKMITKIPVYKKISNQNDDNSFKEGSKSKCNGNKMSKQNLNKKSYHQTIVNEKVLRQRKKSKQITTNINKQFKQTIPPKYVSNQLKQKHSQQQIKSRQSVNQKMKMKNVQSHKQLQKSTQLHKKKPSSKKSLKNLQNKSLCKKKSQNKTIKNKI